MSKIILKSKLSWVIIAFLLFLAFLIFLSIYLQLEAMKLLFDFSKSNMIYFLIYQVSSLFVEILWKSLKSLLDIIIKKQTYDILSNKKNNFFESLSVQNPKHIRKEKITKYIFDLETNLNFYINSFLETFYNIIWNITVFIFLLAFIIIESIILSPWMAIFLLFILLSLIFFIIFPKFAAKKNKEKNKHFLKEKEIQFNKFTNLVTNFKYFYWHNKIMNFHKEASNSLLQVNKISLQMYKNRFFYEFIENLINNFIYQLSLISMSLIVLLNPINKLFLSLSEKIFYSMVETGDEVIGDYKNFKIMHNLKTRIEKFEFSTAIKEFENINIQKITLKNLNLKFDKKIIFKNFNYTFEQNNKYLIIGESGIGKSSLIKIILNDLENDLYTGELLFNDNIVKEEEFHNLYNQMIYITNLEVEYKAKAIEVLTLFSKEIKEDKLKIAVEKSIIDFDLHQNYDSLSTGQKQRVQIARIFYFEKNILILDEAMSGIDKDTRIKILQNISEIKNVIFILVSHHVGLEETEFFNNILNLNSNKL